jgi:hypothetical protein
MTRLIGRLLIFAARLAAMACVFIVVAARRRLQPKEVQS